MMTSRSLYVSVAALLCASTALPQEISTAFGTDFAVSPDELPSTGAEYCPFVGQNSQNRVIWGDSHLHPSYFWEAGLVGDWISLIEGTNIHRFVAYRDGVNKTSMSDPFTTEGTFGSCSPGSLWKWMANSQDVRRGDVLAIAQDGNLSNDNLFPETAQPAFHHARVIDIPTSRWTAHGAFRIGAQGHAESWMEPQGRAYTSLIWYTL
ncbi:DUF3604 domain-containing protein (plasmid) [Rhodobacteraceae bacterium SC52]|nr:DUF3604 domain-containing protein [Rhodobacteraceae bacterium SC52]